MDDQKLGTKVIQNGDAEILLLYSNRAIADAERLMGKGIIGVLNGFETGQSGVNEIAALLAAGMEAARRYYRLGGKRVTLNQAFEIMDQIGFTVAMANVFEAVGEVIAFEPEDEESDPEKK